MVLTMPPRAAQVPRESVSLVQCYAGGSHRAAVVVEARVRPEGLGEAGERALRDLDTVSRLAEGQGTGLTLAGCPVTARIAR